MRCREPILEGDRGLIRPLAREVIGDQAAYSMEPMHLECFLQTILPHGPECPHCRGVEPRDHAPDCAMRTTGLCDCQPMPEGK